MARPRWVLVALLVLALVLLLTRRGLAVLFKADVGTEFKPELARALPLLDQAHADAAIKRGAVVTGGTEPAEHSTTGLHPVGYALDLRINDLSAAQVSALETALRVRLNGDTTLNRPYQVIRKPDHLHVEYQPYAGWRPR